MSDPSDNAGGGATPEPRGRSPWAPVCNHGSGGTTVGREDGVVEESLVGTTVGSYRVLSLIGQGGIGSVYSAEHPLIGARVAIKVLHAQFAAMPGMGDRFVREARATNLVPSPYVVRIQDFGQLPDGRQYAVMDHLKGAALDQLLENTGPLSLQRALQLLVQAASALSAAHDAGIVHRDIKPDNLFVTMESGAERLRILDFGIAKLMETQASEGQTVAGMLVGTPSYCSPEQAMQQPVGPPADVFALGAVAYEMLVGTQLFTAANVFELLADKIRGGDVQLRGRVTFEAPLVDLLESMLRFDPSQRPAMKSVERALSGLLASCDPSQVVSAQTSSTPSLPAASVSPTPKTAGFASPVADLCPATDGSEPPSSTATQRSSASVPPANPRPTASVPARTVMGLGPTGPRDTGSATRAPMTFTPSAIIEPRRGVPASALLGLAALPIVFLAILVPWVFASGSEPAPQGPPAPSVSIGPAALAGVEQPAVVEPSPVSSARPPKAPASTTAAPAKPASTKPSIPVKTAAPKRASTKTTSSVNTAPPKAGSEVLVDPFSN